MVRKTLKQETFSKKKKKEQSWKMTSLDGNSQEEIVKGRRYLTR